jgi:hypothetical protein
MSTRPRSGVLMTGFLLMALGAIFLIENFDKSFSAGRLILRYWPLIPIFIGVHRAIVHFTHQEILPPPGNGSSKE